MLHGELKAISCEAFEACAFGTLRLVLVLLRHGMLVLLEHLRYLKGWRHGDRSVNHRPLCWGLGDLPEGCQTTLIRTYMKDCGPVGRRSNIIGLTHIRFGAWRCDQKTPMTTVTRHPTVDNAVIIDALSNQEEGTATP